MSNEEIVALTGMCICSVRDLRKVMEEQVWVELDTGSYHTNKAVADMLKEKFGIEASVNLAARLVKRWKENREVAVE